MAKIDDLQKGDRVSWATSQGRTRGKVVAIRTKPFSIEGTDLTASKDKPMVEVESEKTGARAGHEASALSKLQPKKADTKKADTKEPTAKKTSAKKATAGSKKG